jgi:hypothetical protein
MKNKTFSFWHTRWGNFLSMELSAITALLTVTIIILCIPGFSSFFVPMPTVFNVDMSFYFLMIVFMMIPFTILAISVGLFTYKYNGYVCAKGPDFLIPFYIDCDRFGHNQPMFYAHDYKIDGKNFTPVWKKNYEWEDQLKLSAADYEGDIFVFDSLSTDVAYVLHPSAIKKVMAQIEDGVIQGRFTFSRYGKNYYIVPVEDVSTL